jgi:uncharacterized protein (TIGR03435 family)
MFVATAMLALIGFNAGVVANLLSQLFLLNDADWILHSGRYAGRQIYATAPLFAAAVLSGPGDWRLPSRASRLGDSRLRFERIDGSLRELLSLRSLCPAAAIHSESRSTDCRRAALCWRLVHRHQLEVDLRTATHLVISAAMAAMSALSAQTPPAFEVASIRRTTTGNQQGAGLAAPQPGGRFIAVGATLRRLVSGAYDDMPIVVGPAWIDSDRFDINARAEGEPGSTQMRAMLRSLLADRFELVAHTKSREQPIYALSPARNDRKLGPKLRESDSACAREAHNFVPTITGGPPACGDFRMGARSLVARGMVMQTFARLLRAPVGRHVVDRTALEGAYDLELEWSSDLGLQQAPPGSRGRD